MKPKDDFLGIRIPKKLREAIERERERMSKRTGVELNVSAVVRAILEEKLGKKRAA